MYIYIRNIYMLYIYTYVYIYEIYIFRIYIRKMVEYICWIYVEYNIYIYIYVEYNALRVLPCDNYSARKGSGQAVRLPLSCGAFIYDSKRSYRARSDIKLWYKVVFVSAGLKIVIVFLLAELFAKLKLHRNNAQLSGCQVYLCNGLCLGNVLRNMYSKVFETSHNVYFRIFSKCLFSSLLQMFIFESFQNVNFRVFSKCLFSSLFEILIFESFRNVYFRVFS